jgi:hypothetical protein
MSWAFAGGLGAATAFWLLLFSVIPGVAVRLAEQRLRAMERFHNWVQRKLEGRMV